MGAKLTYDTGTGVCTGYQSKHVATKGVAAVAGDILNPDPNDFGAHPRCQAR